MEQRLQDLTEKLYNEGVEKGREEAERLIFEAIEKSKSIENMAKLEAANLLDKATNEAEELKKNSLTELKLAASQMMSGLKAEVANLVANAITTDAVKPAITDIEFIKKTILELVKNWNPDEGIHISVSEADEKELVAFVGSMAQKTFSKKITVTAVNNIKCGFVVQPESGLFKLSFTDNDFEAFFKEFLRQRIVDVIFK